MSEDRSGAGDRRAMAQDCARTVTSWPKHGVELRGTVVQLQVGPVSGRGDGGGRAGVLAAAAPHERQPPPERGRKGILSSRATARPDKSFSQAVRTEIVRAISDTVFPAANYADTCAQRAPDRERAHHRALTAC
jgi:hypothetical protein